MVGECKDKKREVREELRRWKKDGEDKERYRERKESIRSCEKKERKMIDGKKRQSK